MSHIERKALVSAVIGLVIALVPGLIGAPELAPLVGWAVAGSVFLVWAWTKAWTAGPEATGDYVNVIQDHDDGLIQGHPGPTIRSPNDDAQPHDQGSDMLR